MASIPLQTSDYASVPQQEHEDDEGQAKPVSRRLFTISSGFTPWIAHALLVLINIFTFYYVTSMPSSDRRCTELLSSWCRSLPRLHCATSPNGLSLTPSLKAPALDASVVHYKTIPINGSASQENQYKGTPTPKKDEAWKNISSAVPGIRLNEQDLARLHKSAETVYRLPEENGGGYLGVLEVFQLLHSLDILRKASYRDHYPELQEGSPGFDQSRWNANVDHSVDMLRVKLMCTSDVSVLTFNSDLAPEHPQADFTSVRKCRNFGEILNWSRSETNERFVPWSAVVSAKDG